MDAQFQLPASAGAQGAAGGPGAGGHGEPPAKKAKRSSQACDPCHKARRGCDNAMPRCGKCVEKNLECTYNNPTRKRGPKSNQVDKIPERLLAVVFRSDPELEDRLLRAAINGVDPTTGVRNIDRLLDGDEKPHLVAEFDNSRLANIVNDYTAGHYQHLETPAPNRNRLHAGPLAHGIQALGNTPIYQQGQYIQPAPQPGPEPIPQPFRPPVSQPGPEPIQYPVEQQVLQPAAQPAAPLSEFGALVPPPFGQDIQGLFGQPGVGGNFGVPAQPSFLNRYGFRPTGPVPAHVQAYARQYNQSFNPNQPPQLQLEPQPQAQYSQVQQQPSVEQPHEEHGYGQQEPHGQPQLHGHDEVHHEQQPPEYGQGYGEQQPDEYGQGHGEQQPHGQGQAYGEEDPQNQEALDDPQNFWIPQDYERPKSEDRDSGGEGY